MVHSQTLERRRANIRKQVGARCCSPACELEERERERERERKREREAEDPLLLTSVLSFYFAQHLR
jgi:hypothetical protein